MGVHIGTLTYIHFVLVFDESAEDLEKSGNIEELGADVQVLILEHGLGVVIFILLNPFQFTPLDCFANPILDFQIHDLVVI